ncbi:MAG TPA: protein kinase [Anaerolineales bacterium]|nr:protein kinase [Anaerolineales bacterium]
MPLITIGRYTLTDKLGTGGMATVYRGRDPRLGREVAVKLLLGDIQDDPALRERFEREAHTIARLEHPAIVPVYDFGDDQGQLYLVMRLMTGGSLQDRLRRGPLSPTVTAQIIERLADALDTAHALGVIHRDLKPGNILFDEYDHPMISDFGIAKLALQAGGATLTQTGSIVGTPAYMSPEQVRGESDIDWRSDLYSFGIIAYEMLTGRLPFKADTPYGLLMQHVTAPVPRLLDTNPGLPGACQAVLDRVLAKARDDRYPTAGAMAAALSDALGLGKTGVLSAVGGAEATLLPTGMAPAAPETNLRVAREAEPAPTRRRAWAVPALVVAGIGLIGLAIVGLVIVGLLAQGWLEQRNGPTAVAVSTPTLQQGIGAPPTATSEPPTAQPTATLAPTETATAGPPTHSAVSIASITNGGLDTDFADAPVGSIELGGVVFELDGRAFRSQAEPAPNNTFPTEAGIVLERAGVTRVFVLITSGDGFTRWRGRTVGEIVLTFVGADPLIVELVLGENLREWHAADNVVSEADGVVEVWRGPITGHPELSGVLDLLTIRVPESHAEATLVRIDFRDTSVESVGSRDPAITVAGLVIEHR